MNNYLLMPLAYAADLYFFLALLLILLICFADFCREFDRKARAETANISVEHYMRKLGYE